MYRKPLIHRPLPFSELLRDSRLWQFLWRLVAGRFSEDDMAKRKSVSFRVGTVSAYRRGHVWYLCYHEFGVRRRPRVGPDKDAARQLAAQVHAQLAVGAPAALSFESIAIPDLRERWLQHHEHVLRSSVQTVSRYRTATQHLLGFLQQRPVQRASQFHATHAEAFVRYLRALHVAPNGHPHSFKRPLMDKGIRYILECCRALFNYAAKRRHLSPYASNPFTELEIDRIPVEQARPIILFTPQQERDFLEACDDWQFPLFLTLMLTGLRPGELTHLLLPDNLDLSAGWVRVRNKPKLGWRVKSRNERDVPLLPELRAVLQVHLQGRADGPVFRRRRWSARCRHMDNVSPEGLACELEQRIAWQEAARGQPFSRQQRLCAAREVWRDIGTVDTDRVRIEFMRLASRIGLRAYTAPKMLRHLFATTLQEGRVDPLIRNELMGHVAAGERTAGHGLGMTAVYTHSRPETRRQQLELAFADRPARELAWLWSRRLVARL